MNTYWFLEGRKRATLTEQEVADYCDIALMTLGIRKPAEPEILDETPVELEGESMYGITYAGTYADESLDVLFPTIEDAEAFLKSGARVRISEYGTAEYQKPLHGAKVQPVELPTEATRVAHKAELDRVAANRRTNETAKREYREAMDKCEEATKGIWIDYRDRQRMEARIVEVSETWDAYLKMSGDNPTSARSFLENTYPPEYWDCDGKDVDIVTIAIGEAGKQD